MRVGPRFALLGMLLLAAAAPVVVVGHAAGAPATQESNASVAPDSTTMEIQLERDGDARWSITTAFLLRNDSDRTAFRRIANDFESGGADAGYDPTPFERAAAERRNATGRQMAIREVRYSAGTNETGNATVGTLTLSFRWTNFTESTGQRLVVGDAFNSSSGTWLPGLTARQELVIRPPPGYAVLNSPPGVGVQNGVLRWEGPTTFEPGYLGETTYRRTGPQSPGSPTPGGVDLSALGLVGLVGISLGALAIVAYAISRREEDIEGTGGPRANVDRGEGAAAGSATGGDDSGGASGHGSGAGVEAATGAGAGAAAGAGASDEDAAGESAADEEEAEPDVQLLSDEERVEHLLEQNGGRMKQATIVKETDWSNAKVSQLLSAMDEGDRIDKLRIGRENLISLPDEDIGEFTEE